MKIAMYQSTKYDWMKSVGDVAERKLLADDWVLISNIVEVELDLIDDESTLGAIRAKSIKDAQNRIKAAQAEIDKLLEEK